MSEVITDNTQVILNYEQEVKELKARVARLEQQLKTALKHDWIGIDDEYQIDAPKEAERVLNETPKQSLAEIKAEGE